MRMRGEVVTYGHNMRVRGAGKRVGAAKIPQKDLRVFMTQTGWQEALKSGFFGNFGRETRC